LGSVAVATQKVDDFSEQRMGRRGGFRGTNSNKRSSWNGCCKAIVCLFSEFGSLVVLVEFERGITVTFDISDLNVIVDRRPLPTSGRPIFEMIGQGLNFERNFERM
jgi:hypothetical protein